MSCSVTFLRVITFINVLSTLVFGVQRTDQHRQGYFLEEKAMECAFYCLRNEGCESFNYKHVEKKFKNCIINSKTKDTARESYIALPDYSYFEPHKVPHKVRYFMKEGGFNCDEVCQSLGLLCAEIDHGFPPDSALPIFKQLGVDCKHGYEDTDWYSRDAHPLYYNDPDRFWGLRCIGFKGIPKKINCLAKIKRFPLKMRLCPCK